MLDLTNKYVLAGLVVAAAVMGAALYIYFTRYRSKSKSSFHGGKNDEIRNVASAPSSSTSEGSEAPTFVFFYATWCPHCEHMMDDWKKTEQMLLGKINVKAIESADPEMAKHKIEGFPTLRMFPRGLGAPDLYVDYKGPRTTDGMIKFVMEGPDAQ